MKTLKRFSVVAVVVGSGILALAGAGCSNAASQTNQTIEKTTDSSPTTARPSSGIANPAAVKCSDEKLGYRMGENSYGQYGVCIFDDKSECEEWAYFRGECEKGDCKKWEGCPKMLPGGK